MRLVRLIAAVVVFGALAGQPAAADQPEAPDTFITLGPAAFSRPAVYGYEFRFHASQTDAEFKCRVDGGAWNGCASPWYLSTIYGELPEGAHQVEVRATNRKKKIRDETPADWAWVIDGTRPTSTSPGQASARRITGVAADNLSGIGSVTAISNAGTATPGELACAADDRLRCDWSVTLAPGLHIFRIHVLDRAGNEFRSSVQTRLVT